MLFPTVTWTVLVLELITVFTMLSLTVTVVKWLIYNDRLSCSNPKGLKYKKKGMGKKLGGRKWRKNRGGSNKSGRVAEGDRTREEG